MKGRPARTNILVLSNNIVRGGIIKVSTKQLQKSEEDEEKSTSNFDETGHQAYNY